jgi:tetratricopeptide (TPR) repeat protein
VAQEPHWFSQREAQEALAWALERSDVDAELIARLVETAGRGATAADAEELARLEAGRMRVARGDASSEAMARSELGLGLAYYAAGRYHEAATLLAEAMEERLGLAVEQELDALEALGLSLGRVWAVHDSADVLEQAADRARSAGARAREARLSWLRSGALANAGRLDESAALLDDVWHLARTLGDAQLLGDVQARLGTISLQRGRIAQARTHLQRSLAHYDPTVHRSALIVSGYLGLIELWQGQLAEAEARLAEVIETARYVGFDAAAAIFLAVLGVVAARRGDTAAANAHVARAFAISQRDPVWRAVVDLYACLVDLADASEHLQRVDDAAARTAWLGVLRRISETRRRRAAAEDQAPLLAEVSDDVRIALAVVEETLGASAVRTGDDEGTVQAVLTVRYGGTAFSLDDQEPVSLEPRPVLRRLLWELCSHQLKGADQPMTTEELVAATWPGQRLRGRSGANRLYVAVAELRKLGLRDVIVRDKRGYWLAAEVRPQVDST